MTHSRKFLYAAITFVVALSVLYWSVVGLAQTKWGAYFVAALRHEPTDFPASETITRENIREIAGDASSGRLSILANDLLSLGVLEIDPTDKTYRDPDLYRDEPVREDRLGLETQVDLFFSGGETLFPRNVSDYFGVRGQRTGKWKKKYHVETDRYGNRITSHVFSGTEEDAVVFLGCSFTFGDGVDTRDSLPYQFASLIPDRKVRNLGIHGFSPGLFLFYFDESRSVFFSGVQGDKNIFIFVMIDSHLNRDNGTSAHLRTVNDLANHPLYRVEDGKVEYLGTFDQSWEKHSLRFLGRLSITRSLDLDFPRLGKDDYVLSASLLNELRTRFSSYGDFYVVFYPGETLLRSLKSELENLGIRVFDYTVVDWESFLGPRATLPGDGHPSQTAYRIFSRLLFRELNREGIL